MKNFITLFIVTLALSVKLYSQPVIDTYTNVSPPSPTASSLGSYGQVPVGMFTGTAQFNIPLYQLKSRNMSLPISLDYSSNGVKVDKIASWVGMDWSLNAGGVITRTVRDNPDEKGTRITFEDIANDDLGTWEQIVMDPNHNNIDTEPDLYAFNFNGFSGKFIIDLDSIPRLIPYQDLSIEMFFISGGDMNFIITTKDGVKYYFGENGVIESSTLLGGSCTSRPSNSSAWYLTRIVHPTGDKITLSYKQNTLWYTTNISQSLTDVDQYSILSCSDCNNFSDNITCFNQLFAYTWHLDTISSDNINVIFETSDRTDHDDYKLDAIRVQEKGFSNSERRFDFTYLISDNKDNRDNNWTDFDDQFHSRMFLAKVEETNLGESSKVHSFGYHDINALPVRSSFSQDHWGYYNGAWNFNNFLHVPNEVSQYFTNYNAADREPNANFAIYGLLKSIIYPTGGSSEIEYEANSYYSNSTNIETGGLRVKRITSKETVNTQDEIIRYYYATLADLSISSGIEPEIPGYYSSTNQEVACGGSPLTIKNCITHNLSSSGSNMYNISGNHIAYHTVVKSFGENFENGGEYYKYVATKDIPGAMFIGQYHIQGATFTNRGWNAGMLLEQGSFKKESTGAFTILRKEENIYNDNTDLSSEGYSDFITAAVVRQNTVLYQPLPVSVTCTEINTQPILIGYYCTIDHRHHLALSPFWKGWRCTRNLGNGNQPFYYKGVCYNRPIGHVVSLVGQINNYDVMAYNIIVDWPYLKTKTITQYDLQENDSLVTVTNYNHENVKHAQLTKTTSTNSNDEITESINYYPLDYNEGIENFEALTEDFIIGSPVDSRIYVDGSLTSGQLTKYNDLGQPIEIYLAQDELGTTPAFDTLDPYSYGAKRINLSYIAGTGNLKSSNKEDDVQSSYIWAYNSSLPVVKAVNIGQSALQAAVNSAVSAVSGSYSTLDDLLVGIQNMSSTLQRDSWETFNTSLRNNPTLSNSDISTYTYDPLIGVTSQTNPAGVTAYYEYDSFGRLMEVSDTDERLVEMYDYNYQLIPELSASPDNLSYASSGGSKTANVTSNVAWTATTTDNAWISSISPSSGTGSAFISIGVLANGSTTARNGTVKISDNSGNGLPPKIISVSQDGITPSISLSSNMEHLYGYDDVDVNVTANIPWTWYVDYYDDYGWLGVYKVNVSGNNATLQIVVYDLPPYGQTWHAEIEVSGGGITKYLTILLSN